MLVLEALFLEKQDGKTRVTHSLENSEDALNWRMEICAGPQEDALRKLQLPEGDYRVMSDNLARLGLVQQTVWGVTRSGGSSSTKVYGSLTPSPLGPRFVAACIQLVNWRRVTRCDTFVPPDANTPRFVGVFASGGLRYY